MSGNSGFPESSRLNDETNDLDALDRMRAAAANDGHSIPAPEDEGVRTKRVNVDDPTQAPSEPLSCRVSKDLGFAEGVLMGLAILDEYAGRSHSAIDAAIDAAIAALSRVRTEIKASEAPDA